MLPWSRQIQAVYYSSTSRRMKVFFLLAGYWALRQASAHLSFSFVIENRKRICFARHDSNRFFLTRTTPPEHTLGEFNCATWIAE